MYTLDAQRKVSSKKDKKKQLSMMDLGADIKISDHSLLNLA